MVLNITFMKIFILTLVCLFVLSFAQTPIKFRNCLEKVNTGMEVYKMEHEPEILNRGTFFTVKMWSKNNSPKPITDGQTTTTIFYRGHFTRLSSILFCYFVQGGCPVQNGEVTSVLKDAVAQFSPPGEFFAKTISISDSKMVSCVEWYYNVTVPSK
jgi:hypothetical protein